MNSLWKAALLGVIAGLANITIYVVTTQHILIFLPYVVLMFAVVVWMVRERVAPFWFRVRLALTAFAVTTLLISVFALARSQEKVTAFGFFAGLGITLVIGAAASLLAGLAAGWSSNNLLHESPGPARE